LRDAIYFPGLNGLRFIAAFSVVLSHVEQVKGWFLLPPSAFSLDWAIFTGNEAVTLFFALSGFLITYLLLAEQQQTGSIHVRRFYLRRMLRIWPLYYLLVFIGFALLPLLPLGNFQGPNSPPTLDALVGHLLFVPNALVYFGIYVIGLPHLWTIGVEEQFYLMWPWLMKWFARNLPRLLVGMIVLKVGMMAVHAVTSGDPRLPFWFQQTVGFLTRFRIENMAVGGIGAYLLFTNHPALRIIRHSLVEKAIGIAVIANVVFLPVIETPLAALAMSALYTALILNVIRYPRSWLEHPLLNRLGQMSYGIYMYHLTVIHILIILMTNMPFENGLGFDIGLFGMASVLTIATAAASYKWFEQPFLRLKQRAASTPEYPKFQPEIAPEGRAGGSM
jgi:peptidoglycan/LPS O-acetylase OafA/YrhL